MKGCSNKCLIKIEFLPYLNPKCKKHQNKLDIYTKHFYINLCICID